MNMNLTIHKRLPRHMSFVEDTEMRQCYWNPFFDDATSEACNFINHTETCSLYVFYFDYLKILYCHLDLDVEKFTKYHMTFLALIIAFFLFSMNYIIAKYFFLPNYLTLLKHLPISGFVYGYIFFSLFFYLPTYADALLSCPYDHDYQATLEFVKSMGFTLVLLSVGVMQLCHAQYRVEGNIFWCNMLVIICGYTYLLAIIRRKMMLYSRTDLPDRFTFRLDFRAELLLFIVIIYCCIIVLASYIFQRRKHRIAIEQDSDSIEQTDDIELTEMFQNARLSSDANISVPHAAETELTGFQLWRNAVSSFVHMNDLPKGFRYVAAPCFFIVAIVIPVIDDARPLHGWCKAIVCTGILMYPFIFIPFTISSLTFLSILIIGICLSLFICCVTHVRRCPNYLCVYTLLGLLLSSTLLQYTVAEFCVISWQFLMFCYNWPPDIIAVLCFNMAEIFTEYIIVSLLVKRGLHDTAYGIIVGMVTITIYMVLPTLVLHECYTPKSYIAITSYAETTNIFTFITMLCITIGVSTCGYEFRPMFAVYLLILTIIYYVYQVLSMLDFIHPFGSHHTPNVPKTMHSDWA